MGSLFHRYKHADKHTYKNTYIDHYFQRGSYQKLIKDEHLHPKNDIAEVLCNLVKQ